jgi:hypothetical protein
MQGQRRTEAVILSGTKVESKDPVAQRAVSITLRRGPSTPVTPATSAQDDGGFVARNQSTNFGNPALNGVVGL